MPGVPLAYLIAPELEYSSKAELARFLQRQTWEIDVIVKAGIGVVDGKVRPGKKLKQWSREDAAIAKYILDNIDRIPGAEEKLNAALAEAKAKRPDDEAEA